MSRHQLRGSKICICCFILLALAIARVTAQEGAAVVIIKLFLVVTLLPATLILQYKQIGSGGSLAAFILDGSAFPITLVG